MDMLTPYHLSLKMNEELGFMKVWKMMCERAEKDGAGVGGLTFHLCPTPISFAICTIEV